MEALAINSDVKCYKKCQKTIGCNAFSFEYNNVLEPCNMYTGGPYTYGNGRVNTKCYVIPKGQILNILFLQMKAIVYHGLFHFRVLDI